MSPFVVENTIIGSYSYIVFPYRPYGDVVEVYQKAKQNNRQLSRQLREYICWQIIKCVMVLHTLEIAHLDIKPDNFILNDDFSVSFIDFGHSQGLHE